MARKQIILFRSALNWIFIAHDMNRVGKLSPWYISFVYPSHVRLPVRRALNFWKQTAPFQFYNLNADTYAIICGYCFLLAPNFFLLVFCDHLEHSWNLSKYSNIAIPWCCMYQNLKLITEMTPDAPNCGAVWTDTRPCTQMICIPWTLFPDRDEYTIPKDPCKTVFPLAYLSQQYYVLGTTRTR